jgi:hypothetical protein
VCFKTSAEKGLPLQPYSDRSSAADACHEVELSTEYKVAGEAGDEVVAPEDTIRAYKWVKGAGGLGAELRCTAPARLLAEVLPLDDGPWDDSRACCQVQMM